MSGAGDGPLPQLLRKAHQWPEIGDKRISAVLQIEFEPVGGEDRCASRRSTLRSCKRNCGSLAQEKATGLAAVAGGISEALVTTAIGLFVAIPAVMMFNYLTGRVEAFDVEMDNSSSELIDYFLKRRGMRRS